MALMTACPACNTRFKVVPDQLRLHHGLVRCGACDHVFDANPRLETLPEERYDNNALVLQGNEPVSITNWSNKPAVQALIDADSKIDSSEATWSDIIADTHANNARQFGADAISATTMTASSSLSETELALKLERRKRRAAKRREEIKLQQELLALDKAQEKRSKDAKRTQHATQTKTIRNHTAIINTTLTAAWGCITTVATLALVAQLAIWLRYPLMNHWPEIKPLIANICAITGCKHEPAIWLQPLSLDALSLNKLPNAPQTDPNMIAYRMQATVRNASNISIQSPDIELTITSTQGLVLARKTLPAHQFKPLPHSPRAVPANSDWVIDTLIYLNNQTFGYTARLVYLP